MKLLVNLLIISPSLNPSPSRPEILICAVNDIVPVPWSTVKNLPTLKNPSSSVDAKNTRPLFLSQTCAFVTVGSLVTIAVLSEAGCPKIIFG